MVGGMEGTWGPKGGIEKTVNWPWPGGECPAHPYHRLSMSQFGGRSSPISPPLLSLSTAMKVPLCLGLVLALAVAACLCLPRPAAEAPGALGDPHQHPPSLVRRDWPEYLSQEQQHRLSQFLPHILTGTGSSGWAALRGHSLTPVPALTAAFALAELNKHKAFVHEDEALHDHYYPDWMDFGRRSAEDEAGAV